MSAMDMSDTISTHRAGLAHVEGSNCGGLDGKTGSFISRFVLDPGTLVIAFEVRCSCEAFGKISR